MKSLFLDTDVILDFLSNREPFSADAEWLFDKAKKGQINIFVSSISFNNIYYALRKLIGSKLSLDLLSKLFSWTHYVSVSEPIMNQALHSDFTDFEDAIQYYSAASIDQVSAIVTRNTKDFKKSHLPVFTPKEAVAMINNKTFK